MTKEIAENLDNSVRALRDVWKLVDDTMYVLSHINHDGLQLVKIELLFANACI